MQKEQKEKERDLYSILSFLCDDNAQVSLDDVRSLIPFPAIQPERETLYLMGHVLFGFYFLRFHASPPKRFKQQD